MLPDIIIEISKDIMLDLEDDLGYTVGLGALQAEKGNGIVLAALDGTAGFSFHLEVNFEFPLHTSAPGKVLLAYQPLDERKKIYALMDFKKFTANTITSPTDFEAELDSIREKGYGLDVSEELEGCHCIGVPVFDASRTAVAALWTTAPSTQLPVRNFEPVAEILRKSAREIFTRVSHGHSRNRDPINRVVRQAQEIIENNLHRPLDVEELAANLYVGYSWFRKVFKERISMSPAAFHQYLRVKKAKELLEKSDLSIRQISETLGFKSQNHFSALFKRKAGESPTVFRRRKKGSE